jgi:RNA polymerase-binding protein DksA
VRKVANRLNHLRAYLEGERNRLRGDLQLKTSEQVGEKGNAFGKRGEASLRSSEFERGLAAAQRTREQLAEVEHALEKFEKGTYGQCDCCGKDIQLARLEAIPQTSVCVDCKSKHSGGS